MVEPSNVSETSLVEMRQVEETEREEAPSVER